MRLFLLVALLAAGCGGVEGGDPALDGGGSDGIPGAAEHAGDLAGTTAAAGDGTLGAACQSDDQCQSGICNPYPAKGGNKCTNLCDDSTVAANCPPPATGCNKMGVCKF